MSLTRLAGGAPGCDAAGAVAVVVEAAASGAAPAGCAALRFGTGRRSLLRLRRGTACEDECHDGNGRA